MATARGQEIELLHKMHILSENHDVNFVIKSLCFSSVDINRIFKRLMLTRDTVFQAIFHHSRIKLSNVADLYIFLSYPDPRIRPEPGTYYFITIEKICC